MASLSFAFAAITPNSSSLELGAALYSASATLNSPVKPFMIVATCSRRETGKLKSKQCQSLVSYLLDLWEIIPSALQTQALTTHLRTPHTISPSCHPLPSPRAPFFSLT
ncbi:hypothetical protein FGO68_gene796 [Halteria grandinella]|uniref:Uncharacterized protein n=1 Tax=Halteria grandinella TaxID=5974 RepID=A0A8J8T4J7_HALGN|nr:hypothetical protein FGO68_gene796 [Halteria grandinella]